MRINLLKACGHTKTSSAVILTLLLNSACASYTIPPQDHKPAPAVQPSPSPSLSPEDIILKACDEALYDCKKANDSKSTVIKTQSELLLEQEKQITELRASDTAWYKSPILWFILGVLVFAAGQGISK